MADRDKSRKNNSNKFKSSSILALGNCDGKIIFYDIDSEYEGKYIYLVYYQIKKCYTKQKFLT